jgi:hypothetical protein
MKNNTRYIAKGFFMLLLATCLLISSAGLHHSSSVPKNIASPKKETSKGKNEEKKVSMGHGIEAVIGSILNHDFIKYSECLSFDFSFLQTKSVTIAKKFFIAEKYRSILFTHIISPNAP